MNQLKSITVVLCILVMCIITSCKEESKDNSIDGVYASIGYGTLVKIEDGNYIIADRTEISCTPIMDGSVDEFPGDILKNNDTLQIKMGINTYYFSQIEDAPEICKADSKAYKEAEAKANDPEYNFEVLWRNFLDHYAYFELRDVDPDVMYNKYRSMVTAETTDDETERELSPAQGQTVLTTSTVLALYPSLPSSLRKTYSPFQSFSLRWLIK